MGGPATGSTPEATWAARWHLQIAAVLKAEEERRAKCDAFSMGELERLEVGSRLGGMQRRWWSHGARPSLAEREAEFFVEDWGDGAGTDNGASALVEASKRALRRWDARLSLAVWRATAARDTGPGVRVVKNRGSRGNGAALFPEMGVFAPPSPFFKNV